jgi:uncharacterized protein (TIGR02596 family)
VLSALINIGKGNRGFSLLELLLVMVLMATLFALALGGYTSMAQATALTSGAEMINDALSEARQSAVTQNCSVEVRFYALPSQANSPPSYEALQLHWLKANGTTPPLGLLAVLPISVAIDATSTHSSLIGANNQTATPDATDRRLNSETRVFHFLPDGSTDLNPATKWFLTVRAATQSDPTHFPSNWACVEVNATTGRVQVYRP